MGLHGATLEKNPKASAGTECSHVSNFGSLMDGACNTSAARAVLGAGLLPDAIQSKVLVMTFKTLQSMGLGMELCFPHYIGPSHLVRQPMYVKEPSFKKSVKETFLCCHSRFLEYSPHTHTHRGEVGPHPPDLLGEFEDLALPPCLGLAEKHTSLWLTLSLEGSPPTFITLIILLLF